MGKTLFQWYAEYGQPEGVDKQQIQEVLNDLFMFAVAVGEPGYPTLSSLEAFADSDRFKCWDEGTQTLFHADLDRIRFYQRRLAAAVCPEGVEHGEAPAHVAQ